MIGTIRSTELLLNYIDFQENLVKLSKACNLRLNGNVFSTRSKSISDYSFDAFNAVIYSSYRYFKGAFEMIDIPSI